MYFGSIYSGDPHLRLLSHHAEHCMRVVIGDVHVVHISTATTTRDTRKVGAFPLGKSARQPLRPSLQTLEAFNYIALKGALRLYSLKCAKKLMLTTNFARKCNKHNFTAFSLTKVLMHLLLFELYNKRRKKYEKFAVNKYSVV